MNHQISSIRRLAVLLLISAAPAFAAVETTAAVRRMPAAAPSALRLALPRELATAPADSAALEEIYRRSVRSDEEAAAFFYSGAFLRLGLGGQRRVIDAAMALDPAGFRGRCELLPNALRAEYRAKARQAAGSLGQPRVACSSSID
jgi:hypothetical protein